MVYLKNCLGNNFHTFQGPQFMTEENVNFINTWEVHDSADYVDWSKAERMILSNLKPSVKKISLRLPESMIEELKLLANKRDVPYQTLMKMFLAERIEKEIRLH